MARLAGRLGTWHASLRNGPAAQRDDEVDHAPLQTLLEASLHMHPTLRTYCGRLGRKPEIRIRRGGGRGWHVVKPNKVACAARCKAGLDLGTLFSVVWKGFDEMICLARSAALPQTPRLRPRPRPPPAHQTCAGKLWRSACAPELSNRLPIKVSTCQTSI